METKPRLRAPYDRLSRQAGDGTQDPWVQGEWITYPLQLQHGDYMVISSNS